MGEYYMPGPTDLQYKDELRKDKMFYEDIVELAKSGKNDVIIATLEKQIQRINETLQD